MEKVKLKMERIKQDCGPVCETRPEKQEIIGKKFYNMIRKEFSCCSLFASQDFDAYTYFRKPPRKESTYLPSVYCLCHCQFVTDVALLFLKIPQFLVEDFTYHGQIKIVNSFRDDSNGTANLWVDFTP